MTKKKKEKEKKNQGKTESCEEKDVVVGAEEKAAAKQDKEEASCEDPIEVLQKELDEWKDKYLRLSAEFDNFRKRTLKEKLEMSKIAGKDMLSDFLPVMDDFERAMTAMQATQEIEPVKEGLTLIYSKCLTFLKQQRVTEIEAMHQPFDTELHDAVTKIPAPEEEMKGKIIDVIQKGYLIDEKVLRYAKVVIGD